MELKKINSNASKGEVASRVSTPNNSFVVGINNESSSLINNKLANKEKKDQ